MELIRKARLLIRKGRKVENTVCCVAVVDQLSEVLPLGRPWLERAWHPLVGLRLCFCLD